jgi:hypothetical protein
MKRPSVFVYTYSFDVLWRALARNECRTLIALPSTQALRGRDTSSPRGGDLDAP